jgi:hypothetical protein
MTEDKNSFIERIQNFHIVMWLLKDTCWVLNYKWTSLFMIFPTLSAAFYITYRLRQGRADLFHNLAICCWILGNSTWMVGDFLLKDQLRPQAATFFVVGMLLAIYYYVSDFIQKLRLKGE